MAKKSTARGANFSRHILIVTLIVAMLASGATDRAAVVSPSGHLHATNRVAICKQESGT